MDRPADLLPLPTQPWDERPDELPLDVEECRTALFDARGNISVAAGILKVAPARLRYFVSKSLRLQREQIEFREQLLDRFESNVWDAMESEDCVRRDTMTRYVGSNLAHSRGWGAKAASLSLKTPAGNFTVRWADGTEIGVSTPDNDEIIEGEVIKDAG